MKPGSTYLITKKTNDDHFFLLPSGLTNQILLYTLILKAVRYGLLIHGFCFMSNHFHLVVTDVRGQLPAFMREFLSDTSKALQAVMGENRQIWSGKRYSDVLLLDLDAAERKLVYTVTDPMRSKLCAAEDWPGLNSVRWKDGDTLSAERPDVYFSKRYRPASVAIALAPLPSCYSELDGKREVLANEESRRRVQESIESEQRLIRQSLARKKVRLAGPAKVLAASRLQRGSHPVQLLMPRFATRDRGLLKAAIADRRQFGSKHQASKKRYLGGHPKTIFPPGTYGYRELLGVRVEGAAA